MVARPSGEGRVTIAPCRVAYRAFGQLNQARDNTVLVATWLLGRSEAVRYPTFLTHIVSIIGTPCLGAFDRVLWSTFRTELDNGVRTSLAPDSKR